MGPKVGPSSNDTGLDDGLQEHMKSPGSGASSVRVPAFLNSLPRWLLKIQCGFQGFLRSILQSRGRNVDPTSRRSSTWPMPLPFPEVFTGGSCGAIADSHLKRLVSLQVALFDWFVLGRPDAAPCDLALGMRLTSRQWTAARMLMELVVDENTPEFIEAGDMGRAAAKNEDHEAVLASLCRAASMGHVFDYCGGDGCSRPDFSLGGGLRCGELVGRSSRGDVAKAKPLVADRITVPEMPRFDPLPHFDRRTAERYKFPLTKGRRPEEVEDQPPNVQIRASASERIKLLCKLASAGMLLPVDRSSFWPGFENGMFAVVKDAERDRLVLDSRASNLLDVGQSLWSGAMASAASLAMIYLDDDYLLLSSGEDLKDYFYQFRVNAERTSRNVLKGGLTTSEFTQVFGAAPRDDGPIHHVGLSTLAMGDICAVEYAQCSHTSLCLKFEVFSVNEIITLRGSIPRGLLQAGIIVDDLVILEHVLRADYINNKLENSQGATRTARAREAYRLAELPHNPKKGFVNEPHARYWGVEIDGVKGTLRASSLRMWPLALITLRTCSLGLATVGLLEALAGSWVAVLGVRRRLFSAMEVIFEPLGIPDQKAVIRLSPELKSELMAMILLGPLAVVNLRSKPADFMVATDASLDALAAVKAAVPPQITREVSRFCLRKGVWSRLLQPAAAWEKSHGLLQPEDEVPGDTLCCNPLWDTMARGFTFTTTWIKKVSRSQHINVLELKAIVAEEKRICERHQSIRVLAGLDSQVCLGALVKGRASSAPLNNILRQSMPYAISSDVYLQFMYFNTKHNRADGPSRDSEPEPPDVPTPPWVDDLAADSTASFDAWMAMHCRDLVRHELPFNEIGGPVEVDILTSRSVRSRSYFSSRGGPRHSGVEPRRDCGSGSGYLPTCDVPDEVLEPVVSKLPVSWRDKSLLCSEAISILESFSKSQVLFRDPASGFSAPGGIDLFSGRRGVAREMLSFGAPWVITFDFEHGPGQDLLQPELRQKIRRLIELKAVSTLGAAPVCSSFSVAVTPPVRSSKHPRGIRGLRLSMRKKVADGNSHNDYIAELLVICEGVGIAYWVENPDTSWWWRQKKWRRFRKTNSPFIFRCCFCRFGTGWKKPTRVATNTAIGGLAMWCRCSENHILLRGTHPTKRIPWTLVAQPYPRGFSRLLAAALCSHVGWCESGRLNISGCARCGSLRIGEATNPGPISRKPRHGTLEDCPLQLPQTLAMEAKLLRIFVEWSNSFFDNCDVEAVYDKLPQFLANALRCYGDLMYQTGGALSNLRHLLLAVQRWKPGVKPYMAQSWEMVDRWEAISPVTHRTPVPEVVVRAICSLAWHWQWFSFVGATVLSFYGAGRLGEVLRCSREDLLLPEDLLEEAGTPVFLRLRQFKSKNRQPAKVQHMRVSDKHASLLLSRIFRKLPMQDPLFANTPYQYRKRWDLILATLGIEGESALTPGGLRAGSAVHHYRQGKPINDLMWMLRLRSQSTLESYIQEVASLNVLAKLNDNKRKAIFACASLFPHIAAQFA